MPVIKNNLNGSLIVHLDSGRMIFLEPHAKLEIQQDDMFSPMLEQFLQEEKILIIKEDPPELYPYQVEIRPAKPTKSEGSVYAAYMNQLSPGFKKLFKDEAEDVIAAAYVLPGHILSFEHVMFAERQGEIIGALACYTQEQHLASISGGLKSALQSYGRHRFGSAFLSRFLRHFGPESANDYYVWALFVEENFRGQKMGSRLLDIAEERAREYGYGRLVLDVEVENMDGIRLYERRGMSRGAGWPNLPFLPPGAYRMSKVL